MIPMLQTCAGPRVKPHYAGFRLTVGPLGWRIDAGLSRFLIAEGPLASVPVGRRLFRRLQAQAMRRGCAGRGR